MQDEQTDTSRSRARVFPRLCPSPDPVTNEPELLARGRTLLIGAVRGNPCVSSAAGPPSSSTVTARGSSLARRRLSLYRCLVQSSASCTSVWKRSQSKSIEPSAWSQVRTRAFGIDLSLDRRGPDRCYTALLFVVADGRTPRPLIVGRGYFAFPVSTPNCWLKTRSQSPGSRVELDPR